MVGRRPRRKPERSRSRARSTPLPRAEFFPLQRYDIAGRSDYFAARRVFFRVADRQPLTSWRGGPRSEARGPHPRGAESGTIPPARVPSLEKHGRLQPPPVASFPDPAAGGGGTTSATGAGGAKPTTTPARATPGPATSRQGRRGEWEGSIVGSFAPSGNLASAEPPTGRGWIGP